MSGDEYYRYAARTYDGALPAAGVATSRLPAVETSTRFVSTDQTAGGFRPLPGAPVTHTTTTVTSQTHSAAAAAHATASISTNVQGHERGWGFLSYLPTNSAPRTWGTVTTGPEWNDNLVLSETHYHHGDHHHNHHQRHIHHFHDLHLLGSAEEVLDLRGNPPVHTNVIPSDNPPQLKLRPDVLGRQAFEAGADQYFTSLSNRFDSYSGGSAQIRSGSRGSVHEEEVEVKRRYVS
eukprot:NODE_6701_length_854_cov_49.774282_g6103_i0.p1 GENE.NODE_6701_length_854_cov_49.774282_g6103_i0~~NODE_6701_length_854_cov_49.774282_g6103_i0.p1  ORF type:complete len:235 (-),score=56.81 NODE_6701_length_854_cov_49.774282_g6103_i0:93-797(-)